MRCCIHECMLYEHCIHIWCHIVAACWQKQWKTALLCVELDRYRLNARENYKLHWESFVTDRSMALGSSSSKISGTDEWPTAASTFKPTALMCGGISGKLKQGSIAFRGETDRSSVNATESQTTCKHAHVHTNSHTHTHTHTITITMYIYSNPRLQTICKHRH